MVDALKDYWWIFLALWIVAKISRKAETGKTTEHAQNSSDAEHLLLNVVQAMAKNVEDKSALTKAVSEVSSGLEGASSYKKALVDGLINQIESAETKEFTPVEGSHPLSQLAAAAVKAETKREKIKAGLKKGAVIGLKILRGGLA